MDFLNRFVFSTDVELIVTVPDDAIASVGHLFQARSKSQMHIPYACPSLLFIHKNKHPISFILVFMQSLHMAQTTKAFLRVDVKERDAVKA